MKITAEQIHRIFPKIDSGWVEHFRHLDFFEINTPLRLSHFFSQIGHESMDCRVLKENLNYSKAALLGIFGRYFNENLAEKYARRPQMIANRLYANRMGNGTELSGDGWNFRGRGLIQITGKNNYKACSKFLFNSDRLLNNPELLEEPKYATLSACWYWDVNNLNRFCDSDNIVSLTRAINGGINGLSDRRSRLSKIRSILGA